MSSCIYRHLVSLGDLVERDRLSLSIVDGGGGENQKCHAHIFFVQNNDFRLCAFNRICQRHGFDGPDERLLLAACWAG